MKRELLILACAGWLASTQRASAQPAPVPQPALPATPQPLPPSTPAYGYVPPPSNQRSSSEITVLYGTAAAYGVGVGVWVGAEAGIEDPGLFLIAPAILGVAAPVGVYLLDHPSLPRGMPAAIASGLVIGAGEGIGLASYQIVSRSSADAWGFRGLSRATAIGATLGGVGGFALGYLQEPSPKSSLFATSGVAWGAAIGAMFGYGASGAGLGYGLANDSAALGGLIGYNVGLAAAAGLSTVYIPSYRALSYMWIGAGIGAAASLPVYLLYVGEDRPPAKRGLVFSGTTTTLGIVAGALLAGTGSESASSERSPQFAHLDYILPMPTANGALFTLGGRLE